ncbi:MAG: hypothetical protein K8L99_03055 [Anaerolineae bacterium]|nr:hypothetical protein [Anaerolineae bacterium]
MKFIILFVLLIFVGSVVAIVIFQSVLLPGQQQRVMAVLPFMEAFLIRRRAPGDILPTALPRTPGGISPEDLLTDPLLLASPQSFPTVIPATETPIVTQVP